MLQLMLPDLSVEEYSASIKNEERKKILQQFLEGKIRVYEYSVCFVCVNFFPSLGLYAQI